MAVWISKIPRKLVAVEKIEKLLHCYGLYLSMTIKEFIYLFIENNSFEREKLHKIEQLQIQRCSQVP